MWRRAAIAYLAISAWPNGVSNCTGPRPPNERFDPRAAGLQVGAGGRSVDEHHDLDVAGEDRRGRVLDHELPRGAAHTGAVDPRGPQAEVLADLDRGEQAGAARPEAVDVGLGEAGVGDRARRGLVVQLVRRLGVDAADVGERRAHERDPLGSRLNAASIPRACPRRRALALGDGVLAGAHRDVGVAEPDRFALRHLARRPDRADRALDREARLRRDDRRDLVRPCGELGAGHDFADHADLVARAAPTCARSCP